MFEGIKYDMTINPGQVIAGFMALLSALGVYRAWRKERERTNEQRIVEATEHSAKLQNIVDATKELGENFKDLGGKLEETSRKTYEHIVVMAGIEKRVDKVEREIDGLRLAHQINPDNPRLR